MTKDITADLLGAVPAAYARARAEQAVKALKKNGFEATYVATPEEAVAKVLELIPDGASVGVAGSMTARQLGLPERLADGGHRVVHHWLPGLSAEEARRIHLEEASSDIFITSSNAVTLDGKLVNTDGGGNRTAAMIFGPRRTIIIAGYNKLVDDVGGALKRIKEVAAPMNAIRLHLKTPCAVTGRCTDCSSPDRICAVTTIHERRPARSSYSVILVGAELGY